MRQLRRWIILLAMSVQAVAGGAADPQLRGIWMHATQVRTPAEAEAMIAKVDRANLNAIFLLVWYWGGQAFFETDLCPMGDGVQAGYDPLAYMVQECHRRDIQVHAWFVNGAYGASVPGHVLDKHPDWVVEEGGGGTLWYDFGKPQVRRFQSDLMLQCLEKYGIDGLHFDYIRYGPQQCYCAHCQREFSLRYGYDAISEERRAKFPTAAVVSGNPLTGPTTAGVLAEFSDGTPAITLNRLGDGLALLLNWHAEKEMPPAVAETIRLALGMWTISGVRVYIATTEATQAEYGDSSLNAARVALTRLGHRPTTVRADQIGMLIPTSVLVLPAVYIIPDETAEALEAFVREGGRLLIIDGPVKSIGSPAIQRITGMAEPGPYIARSEVIRSTGRSPLVPRGRHHLDLQRQEVRAMKWAEFRKRGVTDLVRDVYRRAKAVRPEAQVTAAVFSSLDSAQSAFQDWPGWIQEGIIDAVIPMAYDQDTDRLARELTEWKSVDPQLTRIIPGLSIYQSIGGQTVTRDLDLIRQQWGLCRQHGARGHVYFSLQHLSDEAVEMFRREFYPQAAPVYRPSQRRLR